MTQLAPLTRLYELTGPIVPFATAQGTNSRMGGIATGDGRFVWKRYQPVHTAASIRYEHRLLGWLAGQGLPFAVPVPLRGRNGDTLQQMDASLYALFPLIPGQRPAKDSPGPMQAIGAGLARLHLALAEAPANERPDLSGFGTLEKIHPGLPAPHTLAPGDLRLPDSEPFSSLCAWLRAELDELGTFCAGRYRRLPRQMIHGDFAPSNTLLAGPRLTGIVDFEFALPDARAMDVASGLMFAMRVWENPHPWPIAAGFSRGYASHIRLTDREIAAIPLLLRLRNAVSKIFWLGKALDSGEQNRIREKVLSIRELQEFNGWLAAHPHKLLDILAKGTAL